MYMVCYTARPPNHASPSRCSWLTHCRSGFADHLVLAFGLLFLVGVFVHTSSQISSRSFPSSCSSKCPGSTGVRAEGALSGTLGRLIPVLMSSWSLHLRRAGRRRPFTSSWGYWYLHWWIPGSSLDRRASQQVAPSHLILERLKTCTNYPTAF